MSHLDTRVILADHVSMPSRSSLNVSLTPELERFVQRRVESGRYQTASEVVREGLRLLEEREREKDEAFRLLREKLKRAADQAERGEVVSPDDLLRKIDQLKQQRRRRSA